MDKTVYVYLVTNQINGKRYVGLTMRSIAKRWSEHCRTPDGRSLLHKAIKKYGPESFSVEAIWEGNDLNEAIESIEPYFIQIMGAHANTGRGYNSNYGGRHHRGGHIPSTESRQKMSNSRRGKKRSAGFSLKLSTALKGRILSDEHKKKLSTAQIGKKFSDETRKKMSKASIGRKKSKAAIINMTNGNRRHRYEITTPDDKTVISDSLQAYAKQHDLSQSGLSRTAGGSQESHKGYRVRRLTI